MSIPNVLILRSPGTNCDHEVEYAFNSVGGLSNRVHIQQLREQKELLKQSQILVLPGGFSYGDDVAAGKILANQLTSYFAVALHEFRDQGKLILGICNGFQTLLKAGLLLPPDDVGQVATLAHNACGHYVDRWVNLQVTSTKTPFLKGIKQLYLPVGHGEGNFTCREKWIADGLESSGLVVLRYTTATGGEPGFPENPNGSQNHIAGICDATGQVFGLMPHPDRHLFPTQHPRWTREGLRSEGDGIAVFRNAVEYFQ